MPYDEDEKDTKRPRPEMLGTGTAGQAANIIEKRKAEECRQYGGMYDFASGKCKEDNQ